MNTTKPKNPTFDGLSFDDLMKIAQESPEKLEKIRQQFVENAINSAPEKYQARLNGLQFELIQKTEKIKNPLSRAAFMVEWARSRQLDILDALKTGQDPRKKEQRATILPLKK